MKRILRIFFILTILLAVGLSAAWWKLQEGVSFREIRFPGIHIENLVLRLEPKLIFKAKKVILTQNDTQSPPVTIENIDQRISWVNRVLLVTKSIHVDEISSGTLHGSVQYEDNVFRVDSTSLSTSTTITYHNGTFLFQIDNLTLKSHAAIVQGHASYNLKNDHLHFDGPFQALGLEGNLNLDYGDDALDATFSTKPFNDLAGALRQLPVPDDVTDWIGENISAANYQVDTFRLYLPFIDNKPDFDPNGIEMSAIASNAQIRFHPERPPVSCESIAINWANDSLNFTLQSPEYESITLQGSNARIAPLISRDAQIFIHLQTKSQLDEKVLHLLQAYRIQLPLLQQRGVTDAKLDLDVRFRDLATSANGTFTTGEGSWLLDGIDLQIENADVLLQDKNVVIKQAELFHRDRLHTKISGTVDTVKSKVETVLDISRLNLKAQNFDLVQSTDFTTRMNIDYGSQPLLIALPDLATTISVNKKQTKIAIGDLPAIKHLVPLLRKTAFTHGNTEIVIGTWPECSFQGVIVLPNNLLTADNKAIDTFHFQGLSDDSGVIFQANDNLINGSIKKKEGSSNATLEVDIAKYLVSYTVPTNGETSHPPQLAFIVKGEQGRLHLNKLDLDVNDFALNVEKNDLRFQADTRQGSIELYKHAGILNLTITDLEAKILQPMITFFDLEDGTLNFKMVGTPKQYEGWLEFDDVLLRDYLVLQNVLAFFDTIPALATFTSPGFDSEGYRITKGVMHFNMDNQLLTVHNFRTDGVTVNSQGHGWADFNRQLLDVDIDLELMRNLSSIIGKIPLVGYAMMGESGHLTTSLKMTGSMKQPKIETNLTEEIVLAPLNIIQRTISWPFKQLKKVIPDGVIPAPGTNGSEFDYYDLEDYSPEH